MNEVYCEPAKSSQVQVESDAGVALGTARFPVTATITTIRLNVIVNREEFSS